MNGMPSSARRGALRNKIIAWSFIPAALILTTVAVITYYAYQQVTQDLLIERDQELARLKAGELATSLSEYPDILAGVARAPEIAQGNRARQQAALAAARNRLVFFDAGVYILDNLGRVAGALPERPDLLGADWSNRPYFRPLIQGAEAPAFSDIVPDGPDGAEVLAIGVPITNNRGEFFGALVGMFRLGAEHSSPFYGTILKLRLERGGGAYVVDGGGRLIYASDPRQIGADFSDHAVAPQVASGQVGAVRTRAPDGRDILASFGPVPGTDWGLVVEENWDDLTASGQSYGQFLVALLALGVFIPALVVTLAVQRITGPIAQLVDASRQVASGDLGQTVTVRTGDELEDLADQFNRMSADLQASYANLEQRVAARTRELATLLRISRDVTSTLALEPLLDLILDQLQGVVDYTGAAILALEDDSFRFLAYRGPALEDAAWHMRFPLRGGFGYQVISTRKPLRVANVQAGASEPAHGMRLRSVVPYSHGFLGVPLVVKERAIGLLGLFHSEYGHFTARHEELAVAFAAQAAAAIDNARLFAAEQRRAEQFRVINETGRRLTSILDLDELLGQTVRLIQATFGYYHVHIGLIEQDAVLYKASAGVWRDQTECRMCSGYRYQVGVDGVTGWAAGSGEPVIVPDVTSDPRYHRLVPGQTGSELVMPLKVKGQVIGVLNVESERQNAFDESDIAVLQALANQAAVAIENARLFAAEQRRVEQFRALAQMGHQITSILDQSQLLAQTAQLISRAFGYYHVGIGIVADDRVYYSAGAGTLWEQGGARFKPDGLRVGQEGISGWVAAHGEPLMVPDVSQDPRYFELEGSQTRSELALPIMTKGQVVGVLDVQSDRLAAFDESDLAVLQSLANQLAVAIENARLYEQAGQLAALEERQKLARELHDSVSQALYGIALGARTARTLLDRGADSAHTLRDPLDYVLSLAEAGLAEMRALIFELRPESLKTEGLTAALAKQTDALRVRHRLEVQTTLCPEPDLSLDAKEALYRIAQEAMHNIGKHARASRVEVRLADDGAGVRLTILDDGVGFDPTGEFPGHLGLRSMRERAERLGGTFGVDSAPGRGARLTAWLPLGA